MGSRVKEDEKNEMIIRRLLKLPFLKTNGVSIVAVRLILKPAHPF